MREAGADQYQVNAEPEVPRLSTWKAHLESNKGINRQRKKAAIPDKTAATNQLAPSHRPSRQPGHALAFPGPPSHFLGQRVCCASRPPHAKHDGRDKIGG